MRMNTFNTIRATAATSLPDRLRLLADRRLGAGNFLDKVRAVAKHPDEPFLWLPGTVRGKSQIERLSLEDLIRIRNAHAAWYHAAGVGKGDPVGVYLGDGIAPLLQFLALSSLGAIPALINERMPPEIAAEYLGRVGAVGLTSDRAGLEAVRAAGGTARLRFTVDTSELPALTERTGPLPAAFPYQHADEDLVMLCHTSGTTGAPKAATFAHKQFFIGKRSRLVKFPPARRNRMLSALPQTHSAGISYLMTAILLGMPTYVMNDTSGKAVREAMAFFRPTIVTGFPQTYSELATLEPDTKGSSEVHTWINTGDSAHEAHIRPLIQQGRRPGLWGSRPGSRFIDGLGSSEMGMALFRKVSEPETVNYGRCVGKPVEVVTRAAVFDDEGRELGPGNPGRLGVHTPTVTPGYWNNTGQTTRSSLYGYWLTGDVVYRDAQGRFYHLDRVPDVIHTATGPVYSLPVEEAILANVPIVQDCAVVAVTDPDSPEHSVPFASVRLDPAKPEPEDPKALINAALSQNGLATVNGVVVARTAADFPTGATGKVLKRALRERFANALTDANLPTENSTR
ncbi:class I adenylate-forming enzyme family protein [Saccharopolyspora taberi]|uniref:Long-chain fatty acid--CoA ligase n=1 Tax=Saccharopolyspora taberi TaxID=60895 RepID=A0ABN3V4C7_9PSEU